MSPAKGRRTGSPLENYLPAVKLLIHSRFQVLLTGDAALSKKIYQEFNGLLVDGENLGVDKETFSLFAATEAEISSEKQEVAVGCQD